MFAEQCHEISQLLDKIDQDIKLRKAKEGHKLNEFRKGQKRDDPLVPRVAIDEINPHVSNCQTFVGNDLEKSQRTKQQHEQMRVWVMDQVWEREENKRKQQEEEKQQKQYLDQLIAALNEIERKKEELAKERARRDVEYNLKLATFKKQTDLDEMQDRLYGHIELMRDSKLGDLIYENPNNIRADGKVIVSEYKGMGEARLMHVRAEQVAQMQRKLAQKQAEKEAELEYAEYEKQVIFMQNLLDEKKAEIQKEQIRMQEQVNDLLKEEFKRRNQKVIESPFQPFFSSFNQSSR